MKRRLRLVWLVLLSGVAPWMVAAQNPADELRELDQLRAEGIISESVYQQRWKAVVERGIAGETTAPVPPEAPARPAEPARGSFELALAASWYEMSAGESDLSLGSGAISAGFFVTPRINLVADLAGLHADIDGLDLTAFGGGLGLDFHLLPREAPLVPYAGAGAAWYSVDAEGDDDDWAWTVRAGLKHYVRHNIAIKYQVQYQSFDRLDLDGFGATVGLIFVF